MLSFPTAFLELAELIAILLVRLFLASLYKFEWIALSLANWLKVASHGVF
jgi:hypothetical protein